MEPVIYTPPAYYGGSTWEGYTFGQLDDAQSLLPLDDIGAARLTFRKGALTGPVGLELTLCSGLEITEYGIRARRGILPLAAGYWYFELSVFRSLTCTWEAWVAGKIEVIQHVPEENQ